MATSSEERALKLLGDGFNPETVASAVGISVSRVSQLLSDPQFIEKVSERRFQNLNKHNERDEKYDKMEDTLIDRMEKVLPMMFKPMEVLKALTTINGIKRRGVTSPSSITNQQEVVTLILPTAIIQNFTTNINNQVVKIGDKDLVTIQSGGMNDLLDAKHRKEIGYVEDTPIDRITESPSEGILRKARERASSSSSSEDSTNAQ
jgi:hypothetical protein